VRVLESPAATIAVPIRCSGLKTNLWDLPGRPTTVTVSPDLFPDRRYQQLFLLRVLESPAATIAVPIGASSLKTTYGFTRATTTADGITDLYLVGTAGSYFDAALPDIATRTLPFKPQPATGKPLITSIRATTTVTVSPTSSWSARRRVTSAPAEDCHQQPIACRRVTGNWKGTYAIYHGDFNGDGATDLYLIGACR